MNLLFVYNTVYYIKNKKKWGIYNRTSEMELLECLYDTIVKADYPFPLYKISTVIYYTKWLEIYFPFTA